MSSSSSRLTQHPRYLALVGTIVLGTLYFLYHAHAAAPKMQYHDLLPLTADLRTSASRNNGGGGGGGNCAADILPGGKTNLALTLQGSERRYQRMVGIREKFLLETGVIPNVAFSDWRSIPWDFFIPEFTCPFPMYRVGTVAEGGKWVCGLERVILDRPNCIVYSLNNNSAHSSFEVDMLKRGAECEVHAFDFNAPPRAQSNWPWGDGDDATHDATHDARVHFNRFALANPTAPHHRSLKSVMKERGHAWVDILKVDLSGAEFATLLGIIAEYQGLDIENANANANEPLPFGQLVVTVRALLSEDMTTMGHLHAWWQRLECAGLRPVYFELGMMDVNNRRQDPGVSYWTFVNVRGTHALVDDTLPAYP
ncbi:methyltransferase domain-containing protein [Mycena sanguinolenta]|nr:methyltransferase domain-containing protein [Mycena sanguinolenta]